MLNYLKTVLSGIFTNKPRVVDGDFRPSKDWCSDPLSHPDLANMTQRQLADLPIDPNAICRS